MTIAFTWLSRDTTSHMFLLLVRAVTSLKNHNHAPVTWTGAADTGTGFCFNNQVQGRVGAGAVGLWGWFKFKWLSEAGG